MMPTKPLRITGFVLSLLPFVAWSLYLGLSVMDPDFDWLSWMFVLVPASLVWFLIYGAFLLVRWTRWRSFNPLIAPLSKWVGMIYACGLVVPELATVANVMGVDGAYRVLSFLHPISLLAVIVLPPILELTYYIKNRRNQ